MPTYKQLSFDEVTAHLLRSELKTLRNFHEVSIRTKGAPTSASTQYAERVGKHAMAVLSDDRAGAESVRTASKIMSYLSQHYFAVTSQLESPTGE